MKKLSQKTLFLSGVVMLALFFAGCPNPNSGDSGPLKYEYRSKYYITNISHVGSWTLQSDGSRTSPSIGYNNTTKMRVNFTSTVDNASITILLQVSSYQGQHYAFISTLDNASATSGSGYYSDSRISGSTSVPITIPVPAAGNHFIDIGYSKNVYSGSGSDCAWYTVIPIGSGEILNDKISGVSYVGAWALQNGGSRKSPSIGYNNTTKSRIFFTSTVDNASITILLQVSSYQGQHYAFISTLDNASATSGSGYYSDSRISGSTSVPITIPVPAAGNHFIDIGYSKNVYSGSGSDCAWYTLVP